jgi:hypothetical protein
VILVPVLMILLVKFDNNSADSAAIKIETDIAIDKINLSNLLNLKSLSIISIVDLSTL